MTMQINLNDDDIREMIAEKFHVYKDDINFYADEETETNGFGKEYTIIRIRAYISKDTD